MGASPSDAGGGDIRDCGGGGGRFDIVVADRHERELFSIGGYSGKVDRAAKSDDVGELSDLSGVAIAVDGREGWRGSVLADDDGDTDWRGDDIGG